MKDVLKKIAGLSLAGAEMLLNDAVENINFTVDSWDKKNSQIDFGNLEDITVDSTNSFCIDGVNHLHPAYSNILLYSSTGGGKTTVGILPYLLKVNGPSIIVHSPSETVYELTVHRLAALGYRIHKFNFSDLMNSSGLNILDCIASDEDANRLAAFLILVSLSASKGDPFFNISATSLLAWILKITMRFDKRYKNMANVRHVLNGFIAKKIKGIVVKHADDQLFSEYLALRSNASDRTLGSIAMTVQAALEYWTSSAMCRLTATSSIDFDKIRDEKSVVYFSTSTFDSKYYLNLTGLHIDLMLRELMRKVPAPGARPVMFLIDEADTLSISWSEILSNSRKYLVNCLLAYQSESQLYRQGKEQAENIMANSSTLYYGHQDWQTAKKLSEMFGKRDAVGKDGRSRPDYLMNAQEIAQMPKDHGLLVLKNVPYKLPLISPWYRQPLLKLQTAADPYIFSNPSIPSSVELIALDREQA